MEYVAPSEFGVRVGGPRHYRPQSLLSQLHLFSLDIDVLLLMLLRLDRLRD